MECDSILLLTSLTSPIALTFITFLNQLPVLCVSVVLWPNLQQPKLRVRVQKQQRVRHKQKEPYLVQSLPAAQMPDGRHVQKRISLRPPLQLVQDPLSPAGAAAAAAATAPATPPADPTHRSHRCRLQEAVGVRQARHR